MQTQGVTAGLNENGDDYDITTTTNNNNNNNNVARCVADHWSNQMPS
jgi:hypothetical protein